MNDIKIKVLEKQESDKLDYMAGIVDSEGSMGFYGGSITIQIPNTDKRLIKWLKKEFTGNIGPKETHIKNHKHVWKWAANGKDARKILDKIKNKMILKNEQCLLCFKLFDRVSKYPYGGGHPKPLWAKKLTEEIVAKLKILNERGVDKTCTLRDEDEIKIENKLAYMAGYVDGEGSIGIQKNEGREPPGYQHRFSVKSTDPRSVEWIKKNFSGEITPYEDKSKECAKNYKWQISGRDAYKIIKNLRDYLMLKQEQADAVIDMYERVTKKGFHIRPTWAVKLQEKLFQKCKKLNKVGVSEEEMEEDEEETEEKKGSQITLNIWDIENMSI